MKKVCLLCLVFFSLLSGKISAQQTPRPIVCHATIENADTVPVFYLKTYNVIDFRGHLSQKEIRRRTKLVRNVIKVYPYARLAAEKLREYDSLLVSIPDDAKRKKTMKQVEKAFVKEYTPIVEDMTFSQGIVLLKLVDSPANCLEFCQGTVSTMRDIDIYAAIEEFAKSGRIGYVHFRNTSGRLPKYSEVFIDDGYVDMKKAMEIYAKCGYTGTVIPDHSPRLEAQDWWETGMAFALGYIRGIMPKEG